MTRFLPLVAFAALALVLAIGLFREDRDTLRSTFLDEPAPVFSVPKFKAAGETVSLEQIKGDGPVVLNFWAQRSPSCPSWTASGSLASTTKTRQKTRSGSWIAMATRSRPSAWMKMAAQALSMASRRCLKRSYSTVKAA